MKNLVLLSVLSLLPLGPLARASDRDVDDAYKQAYRQMKGHERTSALQKKVLNEVHAAVNENESEKRRASRAKLRKRRVHAGADPSAGIEVADDEDPRPAQAPIPTESAPAEEISFPSKPSKPAKPAPRAPSRR